ncbi:FG-GAP-like repeat-containing protein [Kribbella catacumbae]|uniref:FG-GAP-like repeat-containing protein n=1 Tax=Kribbella catacumbae TaxID=460086 RepID=UPI000375AA86|nr:FG-GAP-like repeat-containing protein [Kribbella catacumbae]
MLSVMLDGRPVSAQGSLVDQPQSTKTYRLTIQRPDGFEANLGSANVRVTVPRNVTISNNSQQALFRQAIATPKTVVRIQDHVDLDLSGYESLVIADGVHILGGRTSTNPGPRLFTTTSPKILLETDFSNNADNIRISGIRLYGGEMGIVSKDTPGSTGIVIYSSINVEIDNNEIYGWQGTGVTVRDPRQRLSMQNATAVRIHDNYIHHNRHKRREGYGVVTYDGAYTLIERNVLDFNRHALASDGENGTGYLAYRNLVLPGGGENTWLTDTHMFDVHGTESCGGKSQYCGPAGEYFDFRYNTIAYNDGTSIKVRGKPAVRADASWNVFSLSRDWEGPTPLIEPGAFYQTEGNNLNRSNNDFGVSFPELRLGVSLPGLCDFDADGRKDNFLATGATWWYRSTQGWFYLNTSRTKLADLDLSDFNHDGRCDVRTKSDGVIFSGGRTAPPARIDLLWKSTGTALSRVWQVRNGTVQRDYVSGNYSTGWNLAGSADFNADGITDSVLRGPNGEVAVQAVNHLGELVPDIGSLQDLRGTLPKTTTLAATGDLNGDGRADIVWRHQDGQIELWPAGQKDNAATINQGDDPTIIVGGAWRIKGAGDFNLDGRSDLLWADDDGRLSIWYMDGHHVSATYDLPPPQTQDPFKWVYQGVGDFNADGRSDILVRRPDNGALKIIWLHGTHPSASYPNFQNNPSLLAGMDWKVVGIADANADGRSDIVWHHQGGNVAIWLMNGGSYAADIYPTSPDLPLGTAYQIAAVRQVFQYGTGVVLPDVPPGNVTVPNVKGRTAAQAQADLTAVGLKAGTIKPVVDKTCNSIGKITTQSPTAYTPAPRGSTINLTVGSKPTTPCP